MFTTQELSILLQLLSQSTDGSAMGKITIGQLQAKVEKLLKPPPIPPIEEPEEDMPF